MRLSNLNGKLAIITGGSSGIGLSIAERLAELGATLLLVARDERRLAAAAAGLQGRRDATVHTVSVDVTVKEDLLKLHKAARELAPAADILVNSAGIVSAGLCHEVPLAEWDRLHNINVRGLVQVLQTLVPDMLEQSRQDGRRGHRRHIVNIGSAAAFTGMPGMAAYGATKAAVAALSESLRAELAGRGIGVSVISPGFVQTPIAETVQLFGQMDNPRTRNFINRMFTQGDLSPESVADAALHAMRRNTGSVVVGREARGAHILKRISPNLLERMVARNTRV